jgi:hypothetical protein
MVAEQTDKYSVVVLPFLKTDEPASIRSITFRSTRDTAVLSTPQAESVNDVARMLFLRDDFLLTDASYAIVPEIDVNSFPDSLEYLRNVQSVLAYIYTAPRHEFGDIFLSPEHASMAIFTPGKVYKGLVFPEHFVERASNVLEPEADQRGEIDGFSGVYNFAHHFWVTKGSRLYGPIPHLTLNLSQNLCWDIMQATDSRCDYRLLIELLDSKNVDMSKRVFLALRWFNAANSKANDLASAIVNLAIAFEALMRLPVDAKTARLTDTISLLLGRVPRLDVWALQFYRARSQVVHEGIAQATRFWVAEGKSGKGGRQYQSLLSYGRNIFQLCLGTLLTGAELSEKSKFSEIFVTNEERFRELNIILSDKQRPYSERLESIRPIVDSIERYRFVLEEGPEVRTIIGAAKLAAQCFIDGGEEMPKLLSKSVSRLAEAERTEDGLSELDAIREVESALKKTSVKASAPHQEAFLRLMHAVCMYFFDH